jgi:hypothetical protein
MGRPMPLPLHKRETPKKEGENITGAGGENPNPQTENTNNETMQAENQNVELKEEGGDRERHEEVNKKKIRCKKWPQCRAENCEYAHPTETVIDYY